MNLAAYDSVEEKVDKTKSWINVNYKSIFSRELPKRRYNTLSKRYDPNTQSTNYYIIMLDDYNENFKCNNTFVDNFGRVKINISSIWNKTSLSNIKRDVNVSLEHIEHTDDGDIYYLDI